MNNDLTKKIAGVFLASLMLISALGFISTGTEPLIEDVETAPYPYDGWERLANIPELEDHSAHFENYAGPREPGLVYVMVEPGIYPSIASHVDRYMADISAEGYVPELHTEGWRGEVEVKALLQSGYEQGMKGAFFVGDIPYAMFEIHDDFGEPGNYALFPIELYFMDLDGDWFDIDPNNGFYDTHEDGTGDMEPEIWVGRLYASTITIDGETEISMIQNYFDKNHEYRMGNLSLPERALVFVDDDWCSWIDYWSECVGYRYDDRVDIGNPERTTAFEYKWHLGQEKYDWISLYAHSAWYCHALTYNDGTQWGYVENYEISNLNPDCHFWNLFCCSAADYTKSDCAGNLAGHYVFARTYSQCALGSTKTGSMLNFEDFYYPISEGAGIGEAFLEWFTLNGETGAGSQAESRGWFYGMTIAGDPTLDTFDYVKPEPSPFAELDIYEDDLVLYWEPSPSPDIEYYNIYRSINPDNFNFDIPRHSTINDPKPLACEWNDPGTGTDEQSYYYVIRAVDGALNEEDNTNVIGKYSRPVGSPGEWNLISAPLGQWYPDPESVLLFLDYEYALCYDDSDGWMSYSPYKPEILNNLVYTDETMGIWVMTSSDELIIMGDVAGCTEIELKAGWNLVGYPTLDNSLTVAEALWGTSADAVMICDQGEAYNLREVGPDYRMKSGEGYWVHVPFDTVWVVDW